jgi:regulator of sigma E protease
LFIIGVIVALGILVVVHEAGHFLAARSFGVAVEKFSIGFGPKLAGYKYKGTHFIISLIPLGGYVKMSGDEPRDDGQFGKNDFYGKNWWQRSIIVIAGPLANLVLGFMLYSLSFGVGYTVEDHLPVVGYVSDSLEHILQPHDRIVSVNNREIEYWSDLPQSSKEDEINEITIIRDESQIRINTRDITPSSWYTEIMPLVPPAVGTIAPGMPAYRAGLQEGDVITAVNGEKVDNWYEMRELIAGHPDDQVELTVLREDEIRSLIVPLESGILSDSEQKMIGITQKHSVSYFQRHGLLESIKFGAWSSANFVIVNCYALYRLIVKPADVKNQLGGPVMIVMLSQQTARMGWGPVFAFMAAISLILMLVNLLPIPALDGGHILFSLIEGVRGKPIPFTVQIFIQQIGMIILIGLMVFIFYNDISRLLGRNLALRNSQQNIETIETP